MKEKKRKKKTEKNIKRFQFHWQNAEKSHKIAKQNLHASSAERRIVYTCIYRHDLHWYVQVPCLPMMLVAISWLILFQCYVTSHKHTHSSLALSKWKKENHTHCIHFLQLLSMMIAKTALSKICTRDTCV